MIRRSELLVQRAHELRQQENASLARVTRSFAAANMTIRAAADGGPNLYRFEGYASITGASYPIYGGPENGGWDETIERGAFAKTLSERPDVAFLINHTGMTLARTKSGTLQLEERDQGLWSGADLDGRQNVVNDLAIAMERGDIDEMSFAFRVIRQRWMNADGEEVPWWDMDAIDRRILEVSLQKGDVSAVNYGANPYTSAALRGAGGLAAALEALSAGKTLTKEQRDLILVLVQEDDDEEMDPTDPVTDPSTDPVTDPADGTTVIVQTNSSTAPARPGMSFSLARALLES